MKVYYLGQFPPPYGGVTVKNALLAEALADRVPVEKVGFRDVGTVEDRSASDDVEGRPFHARVR